MGERASKEESRPDDQEDKRAPSMHSTSPPCIAEQAHWIEPNQETDDSNAGIPDNFSYHIRKHECSPVVSTAFSLPVDRAQSATGEFAPQTMEYSIPCFVELSLDHKHRNYLQDERYDHEEEDQHAEHLVLETLLRVACHEEGEADEQ